MAFKLISNFFELIYFELNININLLKYIKFKNLFEIMKIYGN